VKTAISIPNDVFARAEELAERLDMSRSQLYTQAVREFLERWSEKSIREALDAVYATEPSDLDDGLSRAQSDILEDEGW
jgi:predicted transcriptional regulator